MMEHPHVCVRLSEEQGKLSPGGYILRPFLVSLSGSALVFPNCKEATRNDPATVKQAPHIVADH